jgi:tetratricopeptide (TPR) repeat protein
MKRIPLFLGLSLLSVAALWAQNTSAALKAAQESLQQEDPSVQIAALDSLQATGVVSPELYQALGNAFVTTGEYGRAILAFERGLRLKPGHEALQNNLAFARGEAGIDRLELPGFFLQRWWRAAGAAIGATSAFYLAIIFWVLAVIGFTRWFLKRKEMEEKQRFALLPLAGVFLLVALLFFSLGNSRNSFLNQETEAVLIAPAADLRVAPGPDATLEQQLTQGYKMRILDRFDNYIKVSLSDGSQGWLPASVVEVI